MKKKACEQGLLCRFVSRTSAVGSAVVDGHVSSLRHVCESGQAFILRHTQINFRLDIAGMTGLRDPSLQGEVERRTSCSKKTPCLSFFRHDPSRQVEFGTVQGQHPIGLRMLERTPGFLTYLFMLRQSKSEPLSWELCCGGMSDLRILSGSV